MTKFYVLYIVANALYLVYFWYYQRRTKHVLYVLIVATSIKRSILIYIACNYDITVHADNFGIDASSSEFEIIFYKTKYPSIPITKKKNKKGLFFFKRAYKLFIKEKN